MPVTAPLKNRVRQIKVDHRFDDLTKQDAASRLTLVLDKIIDAVGEDRIIEKTPVVKNLSGISRTGVVILTWDDVSSDFRPFLDGARIWRAKESDDGEKFFYRNNKKEIIVSLIRSTSWPDHLPDTVNYIYWIQWINLDGEAGGPAGGLVKAAL